MMILLAVPVPMTFEIRVASAPDLAWDKGRKRRGSLMLAVFAHSSRADGGYQLGNPLARAWGVDGRVPEPAEGVRYRKTVFVPIGATPLTVEVFWRPGKGGRRDYAADLSPDGYFNHGVGALAFVSQARPFVRVNAGFSDRNPHAPDPSQLYGIAEIDLPSG